MTYEQKLTFKSLVPWAGILVSVATLLYKIEANHTDSQIANALLAKRVQALEDRLDKMDSYRLQRNIEYKEIDGRIDALATDIKVLYTKLGDCAACK